MSQEIRRLHRKKTEFTNFSSSEPPESNIEQPSKESSKRRRRRQQDKSSTDMNNDFLNSTELSPRNSEEDGENTFLSPPQMISSYFSNSTNNIDSIRAEFLDDTYHSKLADSDYSDDTHDWGGDNQDLSDDYWHFLGRYE